MWLSSPGEGGGGEAMGRMMLMVIEVPASEVCADNWAPMSERILLARVRPRPRRETLTTPGEVDAAPGVLRKSNTSRGSPEPVSFVMKTKFETP